MDQEIITPEEAGVVAEEVVAVNVDTTVEEVVAEVVPETTAEVLNDENVAVAEEVVETVEEVA